jgi:tRNA threonylcarbamoyladenosine biosynthesis protein TsaB
LIILALNTSTKQYGLALLENETVLGEYLLLSGPSHYTDLMPCLSDLLKKTTVKPGRLDGVGVAIGPGSFTGTRVGLAVAKGLSYGLGIPIAGVSTLWALASQIPYAREDICPLVSSRKGEIFAALFRRDRDNHLMRVTEDAGLKAADLSTLIKKKTIVIGNDFTAQSPLVKQYARKNILVAPAHLWNLRAASIGALALQKLVQGPLDSVSELIPLYLRDADIREPKHPLG